MYGDEEWARSITVTRDEAKREIDKHMSDGGFDQFLKECGDRPEYKGSKVLDWLGY